MSLRISACALRSAPLLAALWFAASGAHAQTANETRLREALRETGARLRSAEAALAAQQAATAAAERERDALKAQAGTRVVRDDSGRVAALQRRLDQAGSASEQARAEAQRWHAAQQQAAQLAQQKDGERAALAARLEAAEAQSARCAANSEALYATGQEIAGLYRDPKFIDFVRDRGFEPLGFERVRHENRVRALEDRLAEQGEQAAHCRDGEAAARTAGS